MMKQLKYSVLLVCLLAFTTTTAVAAPTRESAAEASAENISEYAKFGAELGLLLPAFTIYGEYKFSPSAGLRTGIKGMVDMFIIAKPEGVPSDKSGGCFVRYLSIPAIVRGYPFENKQWCIFLGPQFDFLLKGNMYLVKPEENKSGTKFDFDQCNKAQDVINLKEDDNKEYLNSVGVRILFGTDREFENGFSVGFAGSVNMRSVVKGEGRLFDFTGKATLGYNFAPLFNK